MAKGPDSFPGANKASDVEINGSPPVLLESKDNILEDNAISQISTTAKHDGEASEPIEIDEEPVDDDLASDDETIIESNLSVTQEENMEDAGQESDSGEEPDSGEDSNSDSGDESSGLDSEPDSGDDSSEDESESGDEEKVDSKLEVSETQHGKSQPVTTSTPTATSRVITSSSKKSTSLVRKTSTGLQAKSTISRKSRSFTTTMTPSKPYGCDDCGEKFHSVEVATFHAKEMEHFPKHCDTEEHHAVLNELVKAYEGETVAAGTVDNDEQDLDADEAVDSEEVWNGLEEMDNDEEGLDAEGEVGSGEELEEVSEDEVVYNEDEETSADDEVDNEDEETSADEEEKPRHKGVVDATPHKVTHTRQSASVHSSRPTPIAQTSIQEVRPAVSNRNISVVHKKITSVLATTSNAMAPRTASYKMAREIAPNDFQCGVTGCDYHNNPRMLSLHVMTRHSGSIKDWTMEGGYKCEWKGCPDRARLAKGVHQHCLDVHLPPVPELGLSRNVSKLAITPRFAAAPRITGAYRVAAASRAPGRPREPVQVQHYRVYKEHVETVEDASDEEIEEQVQYEDGSESESDQDIEEQIQHETTRSADSSLPDYEEYESASEEPSHVTVDVAHQTVVLKRDRNLDSDSDSTNSDSEYNDSDSDTEMPSTPKATVNTPSTVPAKRAGWGSIFYSPFSFLSGGGGKRKRDDKTNEEAAETPVRSAKKVRFDEARENRGAVRAPRKRVVVKERVQEMEMVRK